MRKDFLLPGAALVGGVLGFGLRTWQLKTAYLPEEQLFQRHAPATMALIAVLAVALVLLAVLSRTRNRPCDFLPAFRCPNSAFMACMAASGFLMLAAGVLELLSGFEKLQLWRLYPQSMQPAYPMLMMVCGALCFPAGLGLLSVGKSCYRDNLSGSALQLTSFPAFAALVWVLSTHLAHGIDPVLMRYGPILASAILLTLAHYFAAAFVYGRCRPFLLMFTASAGTVLGLTALADRPALGDMLLVLGLSLSAMTYAVTCLRNADGPKWNRAFEQPAKAEQDEKEDI